MFLVLLLRSTTQRLEQKCIGYQGPDGFAIERRKKSRHEIFRIRFGFDTKHQDRGFASNNRSSSFKACSLPTRNTLAGRADRLILRAEEDSPNARQAY